jgi:hypothetical protein
MRLIPFIVAALGAALAPPPRAGSNTAIRVSIKLAIGGGTCFNSRRRTLVTASTIFLQNICLLAVESAGRVAHDRLTQALVARGGPNEWS